MAKRPSRSGVFALPGLSKPDSKKPNSSRGGNFLSLSGKLPSKSFQTPSRDNLDVSSSLVDDEGSLLPPQTEHTLGNLTKSRPRNTRRRSPSPLARRKFEHDTTSADPADLSNSSVEKEKEQKSSKGSKDDRGASINALKERTALTPSLILTNDVGLSISSSELSVKRSSPKLESKNNANRPKVPPKPERSRNPINAREVEGKSDLVSAKIAGKGVEGDDDKTVEPPPLPTSPPPLDDEDSPCLEDQTLNKEINYTLQDTISRKATKIEDESNFDYNLSTKLNTNVETTNQVDELSRSKLHNGRAPLVATNDSATSKIAKWQGYGRTRLDNNEVRTTTVGDGTPDRQLSPHSAITTRLSRYETPYSSRQRKLADENPSLRRRRFKPVTVPNEAETINSEIPVENCETDSPESISERLHGTKSEKSYGDYLPSHSDKSNEVQALSPNKGRSVGVGFHKNDTSQELYASDRLGLSQTTNPEPTIMVEYDVSHSEENAVEIEITETVPFAVSETRASGRTEMKESNSQSSISKGDSYDPRSDSQDCRNDSIAKRQDGPGRTLPKVVIEYDGEVFSDPMVHGYDTETSGEGTNSTSSFARVQNKSRTQEKDSESDVSLHADSDLLGYDEYSEGEEEDLDLDLGLDDVSLGDEDLTFEDLDSVREEMERAKGFEDPGLILDDDDDDDYDGLSNQPYIQDGAELPASDMAWQQADEVLFQPPPMFASSDEVETHSLREVHIMENGYKVLAPSPVIPSSLLEQQPRDDKRFHNLSLEVWTEDDCIDWLDFIGLGHFTREFREHHVDGKMLKNINFQLLEEIGIDSPDEREVILSEIYRRFHPEEEDMFEMEIQGALQSASEQERMKIIAVLNALRSPAFQAELGIVPSTASSSPRDSETGFHTASETGSISSGMTGESDDHHHDMAMPPPPPPPTWSHTGNVSDIRQGNNTHEAKAKGGKSKKQRKTSRDSDKSSDKESKHEKHGQKQKKHKGVSKLLDSLSRNSGSSKLTKLFHHHSSSSSTLPSKKLNPTMQYLLQAGPQGLIRIWPIALSEEMNYCSFLVNMTTTSAEIIKLVFEKYEVVDDPRRFYVCETSLGKGGSSHDLLDSDCPLLFQCRWQDPDKHRFELRCRNEGVIKMLFELEGYEDDLDYRSVSLSTKTPCSEALPLIVKKFNLPGQAGEYFLVEVSEENEDDREEVAGHVCPLRLQMAWSAPDHVFRLCRRPADGGKGEDGKDTLDGWTTDATEDVSHEPGVQSELSSAPEEDDLDMTPTMLGAVERDEFLEETSQDLMEGLARLDSVIEEESEAIASQELKKMRQELVEKKAELQELRTRTDTLQEKELEIESLEEENKELRRASQHLNELKIEIENLKRENEELRRREQNVRELEEKDDLLAVHDSELQELRLQNEELRELRLRNEELRKEAQDIEEKFNAEVSLRDREIERLYARNNELVSKEKELESLKERNTAFDAQGQELEKLRLLKDEISGSQSEMASKLEALQERNDELAIEVAQAENLKQINRELCRKVDEGEIMRQELGRSAAEKKELKDKLEELQRERKESQQTDTEELEKLRKENAVLTAQCKDIDEMKKNIIKLTAQLRDMERQNRDEADSFQRRLKELTAERQMLQERITEFEKLEKTEEQSDTGEKEGDDLKLENIFLVERTKEIEELKTSVAKLGAEARENESFKQKYKELRDVESYLTKQINTAETIARQKDKKLRESENKINTLTEAVKDMEAKLEEQEQNQLYLDQLLTMLKDRDPTLLHVINSSLASNEPEEWC